MQCFNLSFNVFNVKLCLRFSCIRGCWIVRCCLYIIIFVGCILLIFVLFLCVLCSFVLFRVCAWIVPFFFLFQSFSTDFTVSYSEWHIFLFSLQKYDIAFNQWFWVCMLFFFTLFTAKIQCNAMQCNVWLCVHCTLWCAVLCYAVLCCVVCYPNVYRSYTHKLLAYL